MEKNEEENAAKKDNRKEEERTLEKRRRRSSWMRNDFTVRSDTKWKACITTWILTGSSSFKGFLRLICCSLLLRLLLSFCVTWHQVQERRKRRRGKKKRKQQRISIGFSSLWCLLSFPDQWSLITYRRHSSSFKIHFVFSCSFLSRPSTLFSYSLESEIHWRWQ